MCIASLAFAGDFFYNMVFNVCIGFRSCFPVYETILFLIPNGMFLRI